MATILLSLEPAFDTELLGDHSEREPPDPIPNSEVKPFSADDSVAVCHVKVGNRQAPYPNPRPKRLGFFYARRKTAEQRRGRWTGQNQVDIN
jgi:hypothetical protein